MDLYSLNEVVKVGSDPSLFTFSVLGMIFTHPIYFSFYAACAIITFPEFTNIFTLMWGCLIWIIIYYIVYWLFELKKLLIGIIGVLGFIVIIGACAEGEIALAGLYFVYGIVAMIIAVFGATIAQWCARILLILIFGLAFIQMFKTFMIPMSRLHLFG